MTNENVENVSNETQEEVIVNETSLNDETTSKKPNWFMEHILKPLKKYLKGVAYDFRRSVSENPNIIWFLLVALPGVFIGLFLTQHVNASKALNSDYSQAGIELFIMELAGCLDMVWGFSIMKKRNLKSSIYAAVTTAIIVVCGILWVLNFFLAPGIWVSENLFMGDAVVSIVCVIISMVSPIVGTVASFFTRNKNYKKDTL